MINFDVNASLVGPVYTIYTLGCVLEGCNMVAFIEKKRKRAKGRISFSSNVQATNVWM